MHNSNTVQPYFHFIGIALFLLIADPCTAQVSANQLHWQEVELHLMEEKTMYPNFEIRGEWILRRARTIQSINDLSIRQQKKIKKHAARFDCRFVFIQADRGDIWRGLIYVMGN